MNIDLTAIFIVCSMFYLIGFIIETIFKNRVRSKIIASGMTDGKFLENLFTKPQNLDSRYQSLKWGIIMLFAGTGLIILEFIPYKYESPLPFGILTTSIALGFLVYYLIMESKNARKE